MKLKPQNTPLTVAIVLSVLAHAALLAVRFAAPDSFKFQPADPGLEVVLVNAKHDKKPLKADALAQANLDGGGNADSGRAKSPLPDLRRNEEGDSVKASKRRIAELEQQQQKMLAQIKRETPIRVTTANDNHKPDPTPADGRDIFDQSKAIARRAAEISQEIDDQNKRPRKTYITPSTQAVGYAMYYKAMQKRIENIGTLNFPQQDGKKLYGELIIYIPVFHDGTIYHKEGGARIEKSSGIAALDNAALRIVERAAPFGRFPANMLSTDKDDLWIVVTRFKFTREQALEAELRGSAS